MEAVGLDYGFRRGRSWQCRHGRCQEEEGNRKYGAVAYFDPYDGQAEHVTPPSVEILSS